MYVWGSQQVSSVKLTKTIFSYPELIAMFENSDSFIFPVIFMNCVFMMVRYLHIEVQEKRKYLLDLTEKNFNNKL